MAADDGGGRPSERADSLEVLAVSTMQADGRTRTTIRAVVRSAGGESALGPVLEDAVEGVVANLSAEVFDAARLAQNGHGRW